MKTLKLIYPLAFALAIVVTATGCHRGTPKTTPLPGSITGGPNDPNAFGTKPNNDLPPANTLPPDNGVNTGPIAAANPDLFEGMIKDPAALAPYTVHFAFDSAVVKKSEQSNLQAVVSALSADPTTKLLIEGNCDERGTEEYNRALGERRALALREALAKLGIDPARVRTISYGKDRPADPGHDEAAWAKNRRGDFILLHPKQSV
ncbi:MAG: OmpA family protein [Limisphaerales bacterium]